MSKLRAKNIEPATGTTLTLGASGDAIAVSSDSVQANTWQDTGGNSLFVSDGSGTLSSVNSGLAGGGYTLIGSAHTASNDASIEITSGIDSTYDEYVFVMTDMFPHTNGENMRVTFSTDGGSGYGLTKTGTWFRARHTEGGASGDLAYDSSYDVAQSTDPQNLSYSTGGDADQSYAGILHLFAPSSTTYVKQYIVRGHSCQADDSVQDIFVAGYINTTTAVNAVKFLFSAGNISGTIQMYGVS